MKDTDNQPSLGDILAEALANKGERPMRLYDISLYVNDNGRKIEAIKRLRSATGCGLAEGKEFVEASTNGTGRSGQCHYLPMRVTEAQLGRLAFEVARPYSENQPWFSFGDSMEEVTRPPLPARDWSGCELR